MRRTMRLSIFFVLIGALLLSGCGGTDFLASTPEPTPALDYLVVFDGNGQATMQGKMGGSRACLTRSTEDYLDSFIQMTFPLHFQEVAGSLMLTIELTYDTKIESFTTPETNFRDYYAAHPDNTPGDVFPIGALLSAIFERRDGKFYMIAIRQVSEDLSLTPDPLAVDAAFATRFLSGGTMEGRLESSNITPFESGTGIESMTWTIALPVSVHGVESAVWLPVGSTVIKPKMENGVPAYDPEMMGLLRVKFAQRGDTLEVLRFTKIGE